ncbi:MAG: phage holin family protein [Limisphaerales bacterium]|jgi:uncharacterized membrane protein YqjE
MEEPGENILGVFASLGRLLKTVLAIVQNRLELFLVEWKEERWRFFDLLLLAGIVLILALMTLMAATITIVVVCVKADRLDLVIALVLLYLAATIFSFWRLRNRLKTWEPFSATLAELKKDKACLDEKN